MPVVTHRINGRVVARHLFPVPADQTVRGWYRAATKGVTDAPAWKTVDMGRTVVSTDALSYAGELKLEEKRRVRSIPWDLYVVRNRNIL